jgi:hypothetical protein
VTNDTSGLRMTQRKGGPYKVRATYEVCDAWAKWVTIQVERIFLQRALRMELEGLPFKRHG